MRKQQTYLNVVLNDLQKGKIRTRVQYEKLGRELEITNKREVKELNELAVMLHARKALGFDIKMSYDALVEIYNTQPNSSYRSTEVIKLRQYSTPLPISYLLGAFIKSNAEDAQYFEPSAGNGLLTIALPPSKVHVNEIDPLRINSLKFAGFRLVSKFDSSLPMQSLFNRFQGVVSNPPFGRYETPMSYKGFDVYFQDHMMILMALETMKDDGKAAFVMGTHMRFASRGRIALRTGRAFFSYVYSNYNVVDLIPIDGNALYARQGTGFDTSLLLIKGRKPQAIPVALTKDTYNETVISDFTSLFERFQKHISMKSNTYYKSLARQLTAKLKANLGAAYIPTSNSCFVLNTEVPDTMAFEMHEALRNIRKAVGGDIDNFVRHRLGYSTKQELCNALSAEQIDAVALAIYNIEAKDQGCIIGDQTGIGKGRVAAAILRYAVQQGYTPIFLTERVNLFSDLYRDLSAIGSAHLKPFIVNTRDSSGKTTIKDQNGLELFKPPTKAAQQKIIRSRNIDEYDIVLATYSQFNSKMLSEKQVFLTQIAKNQIIVSDESHNASGSSNTGIFLQEVIARSKSTIFSSATFAKRPENLPIYALKTSISDANMSSENLVMAISRGGVAMQEIIASQLVAEGQMIRRERSYKGIKVSYKILEDKREEHFAIADNITSIMREIIAFQDAYIHPLIKEMDKGLAKKNIEIRQRGGTSNLGVSNVSYFSKVFNIINQMLFAICAEDVADEAISKLKQGKKPVIAFASTMGSFLNQLAAEQQIEIGGGQKVQTDFALILKNGLDGIMRYSSIDAFGKPSQGVFDIKDLSLEAQAEYLKIMGHIEDAASGIFISPIDVILDKIRKAGFSAQEVTGRNTRIVYDKGFKTGRIERRARVNVHDAFSAFNNNELDVLLINQTGSTGGSAQAMITDKVPRSEVKPRVMIVLQMELNVDTEIQKRGRVNRTGQIHLPEYVYVNSAIPAQKRMMMMLRMKLKSLDANTSSNQNQNKKMIDVPDYLNKYGDRVVSDYLSENLELYNALGKPSLSGSGGKIAHSVSGRIAVMPVSVQESFYSDIVGRYLEYIDLLKQTGDYDLELEELNLQAKTIAKRISTAGKGGASLFGTDTFLEKVEANVLRKPFQKQDVQRIISETLGGQSVESYRDRLLEDFDLHVTPNHKRDLAKLQAGYKNKVQEIRVSPSLWKIHQKHGEQAFEQAINEKLSKVEKDYSARKKALQSAYKSQRASFSSLVKFFEVGKALRYRMSNYLEPSFSIFLGFDINMKNKNPYAPSNIKLKFAIASSLKYLVLPSSYKEELDMIRGTSLDLPEMSFKNVLEHWEEQVKDQQKSRTIRYINTGNLLQGALQGKLISYTTIDGKVKKGVLLPEGQQVDFARQGVEVPLSRALAIFKSMSIGSIRKLSHELTISRREGFYELRTPASKKRGGDFFLNDDLIGLTRNHLFEKTGNNMKGEIMDQRLEELMDVLEKLTVNVTLGMEEYDKLDKESQKAFGKIRKIKKPPKQEVNANMELMRMKAKALRLKVLLINMKNKSA